MKATATTCDDEFDSQYSQHYGRENGERLLKFTVKTVVMQ